MLMNFSIDADVSPMSLFIVFSKKFVPYYHSLVKTLFFGEIILISLEAYIEFLIAGYMNYLFQL